MTNLDQESLFSLELIVDRLCLHQCVECRIPAVAFRLLDFPTLLIYHIEPELAATIRSKLLQDRYRPLPAQLSELKDRKTGAFSINRGKSCLFRVSPNTIVSSLSGAPLYVMVVDMFPETPKLIGSCGVPLNACACDLYNDIITNGISVPAVRAEKKELNLCNLMGSKLGTILLGYRLLSLGATLLSLIPTSSIIHIKPKEEIDQRFYPTIDEVPQSITEASNTAKDSTYAERSVNAVVDKILEKTFTDSQTQIEPRSFGSIGTQTSKLRSQRDRQRTPVINDADDVPTTNILCPPPLFYNSSTCRKTVCWRQEEWSTVWRMADDGSNWSDDGTIRVEDKYLDADEEVTHNTDLRHFIVKDTPTPHAECKNMVRNDVGTKTPYRPGSVTEFPVLNALMAEILQFQGLNLVADSSGLDGDDEPQYRIKKVKRGIKLQTGDPEKVPVVEPKTSAHKCANKLPHGKDLLISKRRSSGPPVHHRPLFAGVTKTQKLRLAKVNPKLLHEIESKESQRRHDLKAARMSSVRQKENVPNDSRQNADDTDTLKRIDISRATEYVDESIESTARYKCPVPTPRTSKICLAERQLANKTVSDIDVSCFGTATYAVGRTRMETQLSQQSSSEENIQFILSDHRTCREQVINTAAGSNLANRQVAACSKLNTSGSEDSDAAPMNNFGQAASVSAMMAHSDTSAGNAKLDTADAGGVLSLEDLGLRKIVDHYSDDSSDDDKMEGSNDDETKGRHAECCSVEEGGEEEFDRKLSKDTGKGVKPELLRKVVNQYSVASEDEQSDLEYEYDFEDTPVRSLKTVSTMNSAASSIVDSAVHQRRVSSQEAGSNMKIYGQYWSLSA